MNEYPYESRVQSSQGWDSQIQAVRPREGLGSKRAGSRKKTGEPHTAFDHLNRGVHQQTSKVLYHAESIDVFLMALEKRQSANYHLQAQH